MFEVRGPSACFVLGCAAREGGAMALGGAAREGGAMALGNDVTRRCDEEACLGNGRKGGLYQITPRPLFFILHCMVLYKYTSIAGCFTS